MARWTHESEGTTGYHANYRVGRLQIGWHVYRHTYPSSSDRWVFQPFAIFDRKASA